MIFLASSAGLLRRRGLQLLTYDRSSIVILDVFGTLCNGDFAATTFGDDCTILRKESLKKLLHPKLRGPLAWWCILLLLFLVLLLWQLILHIYHKLILLIERLSLNIGAYFILIHQSHFKRLCFLQSYRRQSILGACSLEQSCTLGRRVRNDRGCCCWCRLLLRHKILKVIEGILERFDNVSSKVTVFGSVVGSVQWVQDHEVAADSGDSRRACKKTLAQKGRHSLGSPMVMSSDHRSSTQQRTRLVCA